MTNHRFAGIVFFAFAFFLLFVPGAPVAHAAYQTYQEAGNQGSGGLVNYNKTYGAALRADALARGNRYAGDGGVDPCDEDPGDCYASHYFNNGYPDNLWAGGSGTGAAAYAAATALRACQVANAADAAPYGLPVDSTIFASSVTSYHYKSGNSNDNTLLFDGSNWHLLNNDKHYSPSQALLQLDNSNAGTVIFQLTCSSNALPYQALAVNGGASANITAGGSASIAFDDGALYSDAYQSCSMTSSPSDPNFVLPSFAPTPRNAQGGACLGQNQSAPLESGYGTYTCIDSTKGSDSVPGSCSLTGSTQECLKYAGGCSTASAILALTSGGCTCQAWQYSRTYSCQTAPAKGTITVSPSQTTTYVYSCTNANGTTNKSVTVNVAAPAAPCSLPWGGSIASGQSVTAYQSSSVTAPAACASQTRTCNNGNLTGSFTNQNCTVNHPSCPATTVNNCDLSTTASGGSSGSCASGYTVGSCSYLCTDGTWSAQTNSCAFPQPAVNSFSIAPSPVDQYQHYTVGWSCANSSGASVWWQDNNGSWHESWPSEPAISSLTDWTWYNTLYEVDCHGYNGATVSKQAWQTINPPRMTVSESPNPVAYGSSPSIGFSSVNANYCYVAVDGNTFQQGYFTGGTFTGPSNLSPGAHVGEVYCYNPNWVGSGWVGQNFTVNPPPPTDSLSANPTALNEGHAATLTWRSTYANSCTGTGFSTGGATNNSTGVSTGPLNTPGQENYELSCTNVSGTTNAFASVTVRSPQANISATPSRVASGGSTSVGWSASGVDSCDITRNGTAWKSGLQADANGNLSGATGDTITGQTSYAITCASQAHATAASASSVANVIPQFKEF